MSDFGSVVGHARPLRVLTRALVSGRMAHAYLFWGPDGIGKGLAARVFAATLLCRDPGALAASRPCGVCPSCAKIEAGFHPDLHLLAPSEKVISVEEVRDFQEALSFQAYEKGRKVAIISDAARMSPSGAAALLKTVEEPPQNTFIVLLAPHASRLLPTLVSRCQAIRFDPLSAREVAMVLRATGIEAAAADKLALLAGGSPGAALGMDGEEVAGLQSEVAEVVNDLGAMSVKKRFELAERWSKEKESLDLRLKFLEGALLEAARERPEAAFRLQRLHEVRSLIERNINAQLALDALFVLDAGARLEEML